MTIKEGIYDIREGLNAGNIDSELSNRHIYFLMNMFRSKVIRQHIQRNPGEYRDDFTQTLYLKLERVDSSRFPNEISTGFTVMRTIKEIPNMIGQEIFKAIEIRPVERLAYEIEYLSKQRSTEIFYAPNGFIYGYIDDDRHLYLIGKDNLYKFMGQVVFTGALEDPRDIEDVNDLATEIDRYPVTSSMWTMIRSMILNADISKLSIPLDTINDNVDEQIQATQK